jgi:hypothetical protein
LPRWQYYTDPIEAPPVRSTPFLLSGEATTITAPFASALVAGCSLQVEIGQVAIIRNIVVWKLRGGTLDPPAARTFWTVTLDGAPIGDGWGAVYTFGIGGGIAGLSGLFEWPCKLRIATAGTLEMRVTVEDPAMAGSNITFAGAMRGWLYPDTLDTELQAAKL